jgi:hypothetical protein
VKNSTFCWVTTVVLLGTSALLWAQTPRQAPPASTAAGDYTRDLPSVERVKSELKGTDANDSIARQVAVLTYLQTYIQRIKANRDYRGPYTPGEEKLLREYGLAAYQMNQDFIKTHTPEEVKTYQQNEGRYEIMNALSWIKQLEGQQAADTYRGAEAGLAQSYKAHQEKLQQQMKGDQRSGIAGDAVLDPTGMFARAEANRVNDPELRRCLELGGSLDKCEGIGAIEGMASLLFPFADKPAANAPSPVTGVVISGAFHSRTQLPGLSFGPGSASLSDCGKLVPADHDYVLRRAGENIQVALASEPNPILVTLHPDGTLDGPGPILVKGQIITGYRTITNTVMVNGAPAAAQGYSCNGPCSTSTSVPVFAPKIERCDIGPMALVHAKPTAPQKTGIGLIDALNEPGQAVNGMLGMSGQYVSTTGLKLEFAYGSAILDCGQAHTTTPYKVDNTPNGFVVRVQNGGGAFALAIAPDNTLRGSGTTTVVGKLVTAIKGDNVTFAPHNESCAVGVLAPKGTRSTLLAERAR